MSEECVEGRRRQRMKEIQIFRKEIPAQWNKFQIRPKKSNSNPWISFAE